MDCNVITNLNTTTTRRRLMVWLGKSAKTFGRTMQGLWEKYCCINRRNVLQTQWVWVSVLAWERITCRSNATKWNYTGQVEMCTVPLQECRHGQLKPEMLLATKDKWEFSSQPPAPPHTVCQYTHQTSWWRYHVGEKVTERNTYSKESV